jgi:hypothetical protein
LPIANQNATSLLLLFTPVNCPAGSVLIWHANTWHEAAPRRAPGVRVSLVTHFSRWYLPPTPLENPAPEITPPMLARNDEHFATLTGVYQPAWDYTSPKFSPSLQFLRVSAQPVGNRAKMVFASPVAQQGTPGRQLCFGEIFTSAPPGSVGYDEQGRASWHTNIDGTTCEVSAGIAEDADFQLVADYHDVLPFDASIVPRYFRQLHDTLGPR